MKNLVLSILLFLLLACASKAKYGETGNYQVILENSKADFHVLMLGGKEKFKSNKVYSSYKNNRLFETRGATGGKLLHGAYKEYFFEGAIKKSGSFDHGLKSGYWNFYYENGALLSSLKYNKGDTISPVLFYNRKGIVTDTIYSSKALKKRKKKLIKKHPRFRLFKKKAEDTLPNDSI